MLLKLLETHEVKLDAAKIAAAWRKRQCIQCCRREANYFFSASDQGENPSARAITERLAKIRKTARAGGSASPAKAPSTPIKSSPAKRATCSKAGSATKRAKTSKVKKEDDSDEVDDDEVDGLDTGNIIKEEEETGVNDSPTRRSGRATIKKIDYAQLAGEGGGIAGEETAEETTDAGSNFDQAGGDDD